MVYDLAQTSQEWTSWLYFAIFLRHRGISQDVVKLCNISPLPNGDTWCLGFSVMKVCNLPVLLKITCMHFLSQTWWLILQHISYHCKSQKRAVITYFSAFLHAEAHISCCDPPLLNSVSALVEELLFSNHASNVGSWLARLPYWFPTGLSRCSYSLVAPHWSMSLMSVTLNKTETRSDLIIPVWALPSTPCFERSLSSREMSEIRSSSYGLTSPWNM